MYIFNLIKKVFRTANIPVILYLILNIFFFSFVIQILSEGEFKECLVYGLILYGISLLIALSPIGELILRIQSECKVIRRYDQLNRLEPIFNEVYSRARRADSSIPNNVRLFIKDDPSPNAFATGRKTICVTSGLLQMTDNQIRGTLAHEFGHLAHKDTDLILFVTVGNLLMSGTIMIIRAIINVIYIFLFIFALIAGGRDGTFAAFIVVIKRLFVTIFVNFTMRIWNFIGTVLVMKSSRSNEFEADRFAFDLGYGSGLCSMLDSLNNHQGPSGLFATLSSSHPNTDDRIGRLQQLGVNYRLTYNRG